MALTQEIDLTILSRSLKLLHSPDEDSVEQLRIILEDTIKNKYGNRKPINWTGLGVNKKPANEDEGRGKRMKLEESTPSSPLYSGPAEESQTSDSDSDGGVPLEILEDDLTCVVCGEMAVGAGNNLVECVECHSLYHQECHKPPVTQDVNDPRTAWYCGPCTKKMSKVGASSSSKGSPSNTGHLSKPAKTSTKTSASSSKVFSAFNSSGKSLSSSSSSKHSSSGHSSSKVPNIPVPKINITADKRLQIMKKNAAKKHEKRKLTK